MVSIVRIQCAKHCCPTWPARIVRYFATSAKIQCGRACWKHQSEWPKQCFSSQVDTRNDSRVWMAYAFSFFFIRFNVPLRIVCVCRCAERGNIRRGSRRNGHRERYWNVLDVRTSFGPIPWEGFHWVSAEEENSRAQQIGQVRCVHSRAVWKWDKKI